MRLLIATLLIIALIVNLAAGIHHKAASQSSKPVPAPQAAAAFAKMHAWHVAHPH